MKRVGAATLVGALAGLLLAVLLPQVASAHVERPSYWPDPKPDCSISPLYKIYGAAAPFAAAVTK